MSSCHGCMRMKKNKREKKGEAEEEGKRKFEWKEEEKKRKRKKKDVRGLDNKTKKKYKSEGHVFLVFSVPGMNPYVVCGTIQCILILASFLASLLDYQTLALYYYCCW